MAPFPTLHRPSKVVDPPSLILPTLPGFIKINYSTGALVGTLSASIVPLVSQCATTYEAWQSLAKIYANSLKGHLKQIKDITKGRRTISHYMYDVKSCADQLASIVKPTEEDDLVECILDQINDSAYDPVVHAILSRGSNISFDELKNSSTMSTLSVIKPKLSLYLTRQQQTMLPNMEIRAAFTLRRPHPLDYYQHLIPSHQRKIYVLIKESSMVLSIRTFCLSMPCISSAISSCISTKFDSGWGYSFPPQQVYRQMTSTSTHTKGVYC